MKSIIKYTTSSDIEQFTENEVKVAFVQLYNNWWILNKQTKEISAKIRKLIIWIIELSNEFDLDKKSMNLKNKLLVSLSKSNKLEYQWIITLVWNILNNKTRWCKSYSMDEDFVELQKYSNEVKFKWDAKDWWKVINVSENIKEILWYESSEFYNWNLTFLELIHPSDIDRVKKEILDFTENKSREFNQEYKVIKKNWSIITIKDKTVVSYDYMWEINYFYWYIQDVSDEKAMQDKIMQNYHTDSKTWLPNERKLLKDIENLKWNKVIIMLKLNEFRHINSFYWFKWGDQIILKVKDYLKERFEKLWFTIYKTSQVNFWLLKKCSSDPIKKEQTLEEIKNIISSCEIVSDFWKMKIKITAWVACKNNTSFDNALTALYSGNNSWNLIKYDEELYTEIQKNSWEIIEWTKKINEWLKKWFFVPYYQWIRDNETEKIEKFESLIRYDDWKKVESPYKFLKIAEEINLLWELSKRMIEVVISEMREHNYSISINLTEQDFLNEKLIKLIIDNLEYYLVDPKRLIIEVLEDITWEIDDTIINNMKKLKDIWIKISIDDFWTGNSNFARLTKISPDFLKIDWSLVKWVIWENSKQNTDILRSIIEFGHLHWSKIIAEFVENQEIQDIVNILWIEYSQWYHYSKPAREISEK